MRKKPLQNYTGSEQCRLKKIITTVKLTLLLTVLSMSNLMAEFRIRLLFNYLRT